MQCNEAEQGEAENLMYAQQFVRERSILLNQSWQLSDEEQINVITVRVRLQNSENRLRQKQGVKRVFACHCRDSHALGHIARPIRIFGKLTPCQAEQCHNPDR